MELNTLLSIPLNTLKADLRLRSRFVINEECTSIKEEIFGSYEVEDENCYANLENAINYAYPSFIEKNNKLLYQRQDYLSKIWTKILIFLVKKQNKNKEKIKNIDTYIESMKNELAISKYDMESFKEKIISISVFSETVNCLKHIPIGTDIFWLSVSGSFVSDGKYRIHSDTIVSASLNKAMIDFDVAPDVSISYVTKSGTNFSLSKYVTENEIFYASQNKRLFTSLDAAKNAIVELHKRSLATLVDTEDNHKYQYLNGECEPLMEDGFKDSEKTNFSSLSQFYNKNAE